MKRLREYLDLVKFSHTLFALPFALPGGGAGGSRLGWLARTAADWVGILLCMASARTAAMAFNRLVDRRFDARNPRTAARHLPAGRLGVAEVAIFTVVSSMAFVASTLLFLPNRWPLYLCGPVLLWLLGYSYSKRFTSLAHFWLGAFALRGTGGGVDSTEGEHRMAAGAARVGGAAVGFRVRHHLRLPGCGFRPLGEVAQHPKGPGSSSSAGSGGRVSFADDTTTPGAGSDLSARPDLLHRRGGSGALLVYEHALFARRT